MVAAGGAPSPETREALETLCRTYWVPLYAFARRSGRDADAAQDAVQAFLAHLIEKHAVAAADPARGRFRAFLLASFRNHMRNERARDAALKRGGGVAPLSLDTAAAESRLRIDPAHRATAERLFERDWALTLLDRVLGRVREGYAARGKADVFDALKDTLTGGGDYAARAKALGMRAPSRWRRTGYATATGSPCARRWDRPWRTTRTWTTRSAPCSAPWKRCNLPAALL